MVKDLPPKLADKIPRHHKRVVDDTDEELDDPEVFPADVDDQLQSADLRACSESTSLSFANKRPQP